MPGAETPPDPVRGQAGLARLHQQERQELARVMERNRLIESGLMRPDDAQLPPGLEEYCARFGVGETDRDAVLVARTWLDYLDRKGLPSGGFIVRGRNGVGKTTILRATGVELVRRGLPVLSINVPLYQKHILRHLRDEADDCLHSLSRVRVLLLDELGQEPAEIGQYHWVRAFLSPLLNERYEAGLPTLAATLHSPATLMDAWQLKEGAVSAVMSAYDRLRERTQWVEISGPSRRSPRPDFLCDED